MTFDNIIIIGLGLIGGSFARLVKKQKPNTFITAVDINASAIENALAEEQINRGFTELKDVDFSQSDLIIIATHLHASYDIIKHVARVSPGVPMMDLGSSKAVICAEVDALEENICFVGGHPLAGKEVSGFEKSDAMLFFGKRFLLCPCQKTRPDFHEHVEKWLTALSFKCLSIPADVHDSWMALVSHFPQAYALILSKLLVDVSGNWQHDPVAFAGGGLHDHIRLMGSSQAMWQDVFSDNLEQVDKVLGEFTTEIQQFREALRTGQLSNWFETSKTIYERYYQK